MGKLLKKIRCACRFRQYRREQMLERGNLLWNKLDSRLPTPEGVTCKDLVRVQMFKKMVEDLSLSEHRALEAWLTAQTKYWHENFSEHTTAKEEEIERKHWQIYAQHLEVMRQM